MPITTSALRSTRRPTTWFGADAQRAQVRGQRLGARVEFGVAQLLAPRRRVEAQRDRLAGSPRPDARTRRATSRPGVAKVGIGSTPTSAARSLGVSSDSAASGTVGSAATRSSSRR